MALRTVAIVGRPNVGKSTLFNRILGRRVAIVAERPGVTRDRQFAEAEWAGRRFLLVDTGGLVVRPDERIDLEVRRQAETAIGHADVVVFVVDGRDGVQPVDRHVAELLRRSGLPVIVAANKLDELGEAIGHVDFYELGLGDPTPLAALSGKGSGDLLDRVVEALPESPEPEEDDADIRIAVIGRPNVGKSSFVNRLLGEDRVIVHEEAGTTRDAIDTDLVLEGRRVRLIDTAGLRRRARIVDDLEFLGRLRAASAIDRADVCLLLVDTRAGAANQDFRIGHQAWDEGKGLVFVANKWDLIEDRGPSALAGFERELRERAHYLRWVPIITCSALTGKRVRKAIDLAFEVQEARARRVPTAEVNEVLQRLVARRQPPQGGRGDVRLLYGSQVAASPPQFVLWSNRPHDLKEHYVRYLVAGFREAWGFEGSPIRIKLKKRSGRE
ncbi:MAG: ribosome biogenesis GTPase Der [Gemmatimonadetes bacterium]|nr:ribosome biogenesis GTPase Der [Candidatus Palauibacter rhopaloidicola]